LLIYTAQEIILSWNDIVNLIAKIALEIKSKLETKAIENFEILTITNGGIIPATLLAYKLKIKHIQLFPVIDKKIIPEKIPTLSKNKKYFLIDEIYDTGRTFNLVKTYLINIDYINIFLISRYKIMTFNSICGTILNDKRWVVFPWEQ